jgi:hypothetical protein
MVNNPIRATPAANILLVFMATPFLLSKNSFSVLSAGFFGGFVHTPPPGKKIRLLF